MSNTIVTKNGVERAAGVAKKQQSEQQRLIEQRRAQTKKESRGSSGYVQILQEVQTQNKSPIAHRGQQMHVEQKVGVLPIRKRVQTDGTQICKRG